MEVHLIRHGKTVANEKKLYCGHTDLPLSEDGKKDIVSLKKQGVYPGYIDIIYTSGFMRCNQTARYICDPLETPHIIEPVPDLAEMNFGEFEMKSYEELKDSPEYIAWISDNIGLVSCPDGENKNEFKKRVVLGYNTLFNNLHNKIQKIESVLIVTHGGVIACLMDQLFPDIHDFYEWQPEPGYGYTLEYEKNGLQGYRKT